MDISILRCAVRPALVPRVWFVVSVVLSILAPAAQAAPAAPTGLRGAVTADNQVTLIWDDNSTDETDFEIAYTVNGLPQTPTTLGASAGTGTISVPFTIFPGVAYTFKVRAYTFFTSNASAYTNTIAVTSGDFNVPTSSEVSVEGDSSMLVIWTDNAYSEAGYFVESATAAGGPFTVAGNTGPNVTGFFLGGLAPGTTYYFRIRGFKGTAASPTATTSYTAVVSGTTPALEAPTGLVASPISETAMNFIFADNAGNNTGYEIEFRPTGGGAYSFLGEVGDVTSVNTGSIFAPGTGYDFRVRAYFDDGVNPRVYSAYSNVASATTPFDPPTNLIVTPSSTTPYLISFSWTDNSDAESDYELEFREQGAGSFMSRKVVAENTTSIADLPEFDPGTVYEFRIRARSGGAGSAYFPSVGGVIATTLNGFSSKPYAPIQVGTVFEYQMTTISQSARTDWSVGALPPGLSFESATGEISGTPTAAGVYAVEMTATFASGPAHVLDLVLRIIRPPAPPQITAAIGAQTLMQGDSGAVALGTKFADPDTESAMRIATTKGNVDVILYSTSTPQTVANFLTYDYSDVLFHRAPPGFVVQGGGFKTFASPDVFEHIATAAAVPNEPGISNTAGTIAMAKVGDDPNSATSEFFFNVGDNSGNLDEQNGGFTVFGRVATPSLGSTLAALAALPTGSYSIQQHIGPLPTDVIGSAFSDLPIDESPPPAAVDQSKLVKVDAITPLPVLTYGVSANSDPAVASASMVGSSLELDGLAPGLTSVTVTATDVDGNTTPVAFTVEVQQTFAQWAAAEGVPGGESGAADNPDHDVLNNLQEWGFLGDPNAPDYPAGLPTIALTPVAAEKYLEVTFPVRKFAVELAYTVEGSGTMLPGDWATIWTSAEGFAVPAVTAAVDQSDRTVVTVRDSVPSPTATQRYLRVIVH